MSDAVSGGATAGPTATRPLTQLVKGGELRCGERTFHVGPDGLTVGRSSSADVQLDDREVSALHCELRAGPRGVELRDLGSRNGTWVGGIALDSARLGESCTLRVGSTELHFELARKPELVADDADAETSFGPLVGGAPRMRRLYRVLRAVAPTELSVLIMAETGTGKELVAQALHGASPRASGPFVVVDCGALPATLAESILFGHEKGSFTGASARRAGAFLEADGGTVFLDELGELPEELQPKLLRVVAERSVKRVGANRYEPVDVRIIAATRRDLRREMNAARFREDLYFRLAQVRVELPPLRERSEDIPALIARACERVGRAGAEERVARYIKSRFRNYDWPGNVRELMNVASVLAAIGDTEAEPLLDDVLPLERAASSSVASASTAEGFVQAKRNFEEEYFRRLLEATGGNISEIARRCGLARHRVRDHLRKLGLM